jgi:MoCo/4Fe-4S cofactor protein with predicted Tat translocation signal
MGKQKKYWKGQEDLVDSKELRRRAENEFPEELPVDEIFKGGSEAGSSRRDFLKLMGFTVGAAALASCEAPVKKSIPYLIKPEEVTPGVANWYASNFYDGYDFCDILVKTREGRPIKIEGNPASGITKGATHARIQAAVLSLYDSARFRGPKIGGKDVTWDEADRTVTAKLAAVASFGGGIRILSSTIISPSTLAIIEAFKLKFPGARHVMYDAVSYSSMSSAYEAHSGKKIIPSFNFDKAKSIVSLGADFLANWLSPVAFAAQYAALRRVEKNFGKHFQFESVMSLTGSNADKRVAIKPSEQGKIVIALYNEIAGRSGNALLTQDKTPYDADIKEAAASLWENKGQSIVVAASNDVHVQFLVAGINKMLGNEGSTIDADNPLYLKQGSDEALRELTEEMRGGKVNVLLTYNCNPAYNLPAAAGFGEALAKVETKIALADRPDETTELCDIICPDHHFLEAWNDAHAKQGHLSLAQPTIMPLFNTRQAQESLMKWAGLAGDYHGFMQKNWETQYFPLQTEFSSFYEFWGRSLQKGCVRVEGKPAPAIAVPAKDGEKSGEAASKPAPITAAIAAGVINGVKPGNGFEVVLYEKTAAGIGNQANNPWLLELPDPVTKATWDNYVTMSPAQMREMGLNTVQGQEQEADLVNVQFNGVSVKLPVLAQPGQKYGTIGIALGFGRTVCGKAGNLVGANAFQLARTDKEGFIHLNNFGGEVSGSVGKYHLATTQTHHTMMGREIVKEATYSEYRKDPAAGNKLTTLAYKTGEEVKETPVEKLDLWEKYKESGGHTWNMSIDLSLCIGCSNCLISCQAENNVPVVGKDEVRRGREMHWIRIDRYYSSDEKEGDLLKMEVPSENPEVVFQPVMCQHCSHAPCETVCPVIATSHSTDGLNQMTYNRCVGTRYCANNCPYKVRRFNWFNYAENAEFDYNMNDDLGKMVLNPDVVVRTRGVMEKCSLCVQRIQEGKLKAKKEGRRVLDGEIQTACSQSCPTKAITFGDVNDKESAVTQLKENPRKYFLLEEVGIRPNVFYLTKIRNHENV